MEKKGQRGFEDLECYQLALQVMREAYRVLEGLPIEGKYNLGLQMRKAAVSIGLNIAEGYGRYHYLDSLRFYYIARGSLDETLSGFITCDALGYTKGGLPDQRQLCHNALRSLNGYIRWVRGQQQGQQEYGHRAFHEEETVYETALTSADEGD